MYGLDPDDAKALRAMTIEQRLKRALDFIEQTRQFKIASVRVHHPGRSEAALRCIDPICTRRPVVRTAQQGRQSQEAQTWVNQRGMVAQ